VAAIKIIGLGNVLMGDDGVGPYVLSVLDSTYVCPEGVSFVDAGTPGLDLIPCIDDAETLLIVDTVRSTGRPGEIRLYARDRLMEHLARPRLSPHDPGLAETLASLEFSGRAVRDVLLIGVIPGHVATGVGLSPEVRAAVPAVVETVVRSLALRGVPLVRREPRVEPNIWWERSPENAACTR
jgi:hydrogenase maturation protease